MTNDAQILKHPVVSALADSLAYDQECYLVGGAIRDALLGRAVTDFDFAMPFDPTNLARTFAAECGGTWFALDEARRQSRVVLRGEGEALTCDFAPFRAEDLEGDLRLRDFTVNALAQRLGTGDAAVLDPLGGLDDLEAKRLRACSGGVFDDDPLRVLKGIRHVAVLRFGLEEATRELMAAASGGLRKIPPERLRAETAGIFAVPAPGPALELLREFGLGGFFFGHPDHGGGFEEGVRAARRAQEIIEAVAGKGNSGIGALLDEEIEGGFPRSALLRLAAFLRGYGKEATGAFAARVRLGRKATAILRSLSTMPLEMAKEIDGLAGSRRGRALWASGTGPDVWMNLLFFGVLDQRPPEEVAPTLVGLMEDVRAVLRDGRIPDLVDGAWIRSELGWSEGPAIGRALAEVRRREIEGTVRSVAEVQNYLKSLDRKND